MLIFSCLLKYIALRNILEVNTIRYSTHFYFLKSIFLVSVGHLCDLQGLFSQIDNLRTVNRIELQLMST